MSLQSFFKKPFQSDSTTIKGGEVRPVLFPKLIQVFENPKVKKSPNSTTVKQGQTIYITIPGTADRKPMRVKSVTKKGEADELELEEIR